MPALPSRPFVSPARRSAALAPTRRARGALVLALALSLVVGAPRPARADDAWWGRDKALHFGVSAGLAAGSYAIAGSFFEARYPRLLVGAGVSLTLGAGKELADLAGLGTPSWKDFAWDAIGTAAGLALAYTLDLVIFGVSRQHPALGAPDPRPVGAAGSGLVLSF